VVSLVKGLAQRLKAIHADIVEEDCAMGLLATSLVDATWLAVQDYPWRILQCLEFDS
jgi:hypothetical protein